MDNIYKLIFSKFQSKDEKLAEKQMFKGNIIFFASKGLKYDIYGSGKMLKMKTTAIPFLLVLATVLLSGCSIMTIRPPSAAAFMGGDESISHDLSASMTVGDIVDGSSDVRPIKDNVKKATPSDEDAYFKNYEEWKLDFNYSLQSRLGYFKYGVGLNFFTPYVVVGFVSDYVGLMGWSNFGVGKFEKVENAYVQWGGGISLIEQLPVGRNVRIGLTQHLSRNGREAYEDKSFTPNGGFASAAPIFYDEVGGGAYFSILLGTNFRMGTEFRFGRDLTYEKVDVHDDGEISKHDINRYSFIVDFQFL